MRDSDQDLVSVITPLYNGEKFLKETITSVLSQTYQNLELIIVDDNSSDGSAQIVEGFSDDPRLIYIKLDKNAGVANARNVAVEHANGTYIAFVDSDDLWDSRKLEIQISYMQKNNYTLCYTAYRKINEEGKVIASRISVRENGVNYSELLKHNVIGCLTAVYNAKVLGKSYFIKIGHEDFVYWLRMLKTGVTGMGINQVLASYRVHNRSLSHNKFKAANYTWNIYRNIERLTMYRSCRNFIIYSINALIKYTKRK